jgi:hypothetical protein
LTSERRGKRVPGQKLWGGILIGVSLILLLGVWISTFQNGSQPLHADSKTLYLVNSSQDLSISSLRSHWHWQELGLSGAIFMATPYQPTGDALEIDARIKDSDAGFQNDDAFGIVVGMNSQGAGYVCGVTLNQPIVSYPGWDEHTILSESTTGIYGDWSNYMTVTVIIRKHVITLFYDEQQVAQATVTASPTDGLTGLFTASSATVQGFRIESLS